MSTINRRKFRLVHIDIRVNVFTLVPIYYIARIIVVFSSLLGMEKNCQVNGSVIFLLPNIVEFSVE